LYLDKPKETTMKIFALLLSLLVSTAAAAEKTGNLKFFYCIHSDGSCKETTTQVPVVSGNATSVAKRALSKKGDFIGFVDAHDTTLQFYTKETDSILVDMPVPDERGSYSASLKRDQALKLIEGLSPPLARYRDELKLKFAKW
jgi:hypothetical protein